MRTEDELNKLRLAYGDARNKHLIACGNIVSRMDLVEDETAAALLAVEAQVLNAAMLTGSLDMLCEELRGVNDQLDRIRGTIANTLDPKR